MLKTIVILIVACLVSQVGESSSDPIRVACIGDSLTFGHGLSERERDCYPAQLGAKLGNRWRVEGFGVSGATVIQQGTRPYRNQQAFADATRFKPDVVVILLGTNDTNPQTWPKYHDDFAADYLALIATFRDENPSLQVLVCLPPPLFRDRGKEYDTDRMLVQEVIPQTREVARQADAPIVDLYSQLRDESKYFADGVHPDKRGAEIIAAEVAAALQTLPLGAQPTERP